MREYNAYHTSSAQPLALTASVEKGRDKMNLETVV
jgi:hypothetical protein